MNLFKLAAGGWTAAVSAIQTAEKFVLDHTPAATHTQIAATVSAVKQGASDAVSAADSAISAVLDSKSDGLVDLFNGGLEELGFIVGGQVGQSAVIAAERNLKPYEVDTVHKVRDMLKSQIDALALTALAKIAGIDATAATPAQSAG